MAHLAKTDDSLFQWPGRPLRTTLKLIGLPVSAIVILSILSTEGIPAPLLYGIAGFLGLVLLYSSVNNPEWLLAAIVMYLPLSKMMPAIIAPGLNGTNILLLLLLFAWFLDIQRGKCSIIDNVPFGGLMLAYAALSVVSIFTILNDPVGKDQFMGNGITEFKGWMDQFILFFAFSNLIRDGGTARRVVIYCVLGAMIAQGFGLIEMFHKQGLSSIEKSRVLGPVAQPNNFGAFIVYNLSPLLAFFILNIRKWQALLLVPYFLISLKLLLATFSRGAYIGLMMAGVTATFFRGLLFSAIVAAIGGLLIFNFPELMPDSIRDRMAGSSAGYNSESYDQSINSRFILWEAAVEMTSESPLFGKGFSGFPMLKAQYTDVAVNESDPHNMYLFISSQLGVPALIVFLLLLFGFFKSSLIVYRSAEDRLAEAIGLGGLAMVAGVATINMFGSRMVNIDVSGNFWIYFAVLGALLRERQQIADGRLRATVEEDSQLKEKLARESVRSRRGYRRRPGIRSANKP